MMLLDVRRSASGPNHLEVPHHSSFMMFENMTVIHPATGTIIRHPGNLNLASRWQIHCILPAKKGRRLPVYLKDLEKESMKVEWMIHQTCVRDLPDLKLTDLHWLICRMSFSIDKEINPMCKTWPDREPYVSVRSCTLTCQGFDRPHLGRT